MFRNFSAQKGTTLKIDVWLQSYDQFISTEDNIKQKNLTSFFANISKNQYLQHLTHSP